VSKIVTESIINAVFTQDRDFLKAKNLDSVGCHVAAVLLKGDRSDLFASDQVISRQHGTVWFRWNSVHNLTAFSLIPAGMVSVLWVPSYQEPAFDPARHTSAYLVYKMEAGRLIDVNQDQPYTVLPVGYPYSFVQERARVIWEWLILNNGEVLDPSTFGTCPTSSAWF
jgi:hypothetical protein